MKYVSVLLGVTPSRLQNDVRFSMYSMVITANLKLVSSSQGKEGKCLVSVSL
jgi:hypothetical protein